MNNQPNKGDKLGDLLSRPHEVIRDMPLYVRLPFNPDQQDDVVTIKKYGGPLDIYCPKCQQDSVYVLSRRLRPPMPGIGPIQHNSSERATEDGLFVVQLCCSRDEQHKAIFCFVIENESLIKIGQYPSAADLNESSIRQYRKIVGEDQYQEFHKAVGLSAHGIGVGSFVYLRRIFEVLIESAHQKMHNISSWNEEQYRLARMDEKIRLLSHSLPDFLVENRSLYRILSKGIHELSEQECLTYFAVVRTGIELILDDKLRAAEQQKKVHATQQALSAIETNISRQ